MKYFFDDPEDEDDDEVEDEVDDVEDDDDDDDDDDDEDDEAEPENLRPYSNAIGALQDSLDLLSKIEKSREVSLAITKTEEALLWMKHMKKRVIVNS